MTQKTREDLLSIGALSRRTGVATSAIRYYEEQGLIQSLRTSGNQRRFLRGEIRRLSFILIAQQLGLSLAEISSALAELPSERNPTSADWKKISGNIRDRLDREISRLSAVRANLNSCIGCGCLSLDKCSLYNKNDIAGVSGTGPRVLRQN